MWEDGEDSVDKPDAWHSCKEDKPKVEEHVNLEMVLIKNGFILLQCFSIAGAQRVDLLVDDVQRQDTEGVVLLKGTWRTKLLERTLRHLEIYISDENSDGDNLSFLNLWKDSV